MLWAILILIIGAVSAAAVINAFRPVRWDWFLLPSLVWSLVVIELPAQLILLELATVAVLAMFGGLDYVVGQIGLVLLAVSWVGSIVLFSRSRGSRRVVALSLDEAGIPASGNPVSWWRVLVGLPFRGRAIEKIKNVEFSRVAGRVLRLDVYRSRKSAENRPVLLYLHGGGWMVGDKFEQGLLGAGIRLPSQNSGDRVAHLFVL